MVLLDDETYAQTCALKHGDRKLDPIFGELATWMSQRLHTTVLNIVYDKLHDGRPRLNIVVECTQDVTKFLSGPNFNSRYQRRVASRLFDVLAASHKLGEYDVRNLLVVWTDFSKEAMTDANWRAFEDLRRMVPKLHPSVWRIEVNFDTIVVFYQTDNQVAEKEQNGVSETIRFEIASVVKQYDEFQYFDMVAVIKFDSKENVDKNYDGSLFYYFR